MTRHKNMIVASAVFLTFSGNCKKALTFYQGCIGGNLQFELFRQKLPGFSELPVVSGSLLADRIIIYGSDLVHDEGRRTGNCMAIYIRCDSVQERKALVEKLRSAEGKSTVTEVDDQRLIEVTDAFGVRWVLGTDDL